MEVVSAPGYGFTIYWRSVKLCLGYNMCRSDSVVVFCPISSVLLHLNYSLQNPSGVPSSNSAAL